MSNNLPSAYQEVEYIQNTGAEYIILDFTPSSKTHIEMTATPFDIQAANTGKGFIAYGSATDLTTNAFECYSYTGGTLEYHYNGTYKTGLASIAVGTKVHLSQNGNVCITSDSNGNVLSTYTFTAKTFTCPKKLTLFALNRSAGIIPGGASNLYDCQIYENGTLTLNLVPCYRKSDYTPGLYDTINDVFYPNAGSGSFAIGALVKVPRDPLVFYNSYLPDMYAMWRRAKIMKSSQIEDPATLLLLHGDTLADSSIYKKAITNTGVTVSTEKSKFGTSSLYFNGSSYLTIPSTDFGANDFTIDWWEYATNSNAGSRFTSVFCTSYSTQAGGILLFVKEGSNNPRVYMSNKTGGAATSDWNVLAQKQCGTNTLNQWVHRAVVRSGTNLMFFKDGTVEYTYSVGTNVIGYSSERPWGIGAWSTDYMNTGYQFIGYIEEFRVSNIARWTGNFTVPVEPYDNKISK